MKARPVSVIRRLLAWSRALIARKTADDEIVREMRFHLEMEVEKNVRAGMHPDEARRRALVDFGGVQRFREEGIDARGGRWMNGLSLDVKLAWRMLGKSPALTVIGVLGIALGTAVSVGAFVPLSVHFFPNVPLPEGTRLVQITNWDVAASRPDVRSLHDFHSWREEMRSVSPIAAAAGLGETDVVVGNAVPQTVFAAQMTAAGFQVARVAPHLGRYLLPDDEREGAPPVAVIGYDFWQRTFGGDSSAIGRRILVNEGEHAIVGVMPAGFAFPRNQELWTALRASPMRYARGSGPGLFVFGRLAAGATWEQAQAELTGIGRRAAVAFPEPNARLRPQLRPYTYSHNPGLQASEVAGIELIVNLLLIAVAINVSMLVYARTAIRQGEIAVRTALGASRRRIVGQLFVEALLLSLLGAAIGLGLAHLGLRELDARFLEGRAFWEDFGIQPRSIAFAFTLAIGAAAIIGVVPGLKATGRGLNASLQLFRSGTGLQLGRTWTALIVAQVAVVVTVLPTALYMGYEEIELRAERANFAAHEFVIASLGMAMPVEPGMDRGIYQRELAARFAVALPGLERSLEGEPAIAGVTLEGVAGSGSVEIEGADSSAGSGIHEVRSRDVATDYFEVLGVRMSAGRAFSASDAGAPGSALIVSEAFVRQVLGGERALGRRVRFVGPVVAGQRTAGPWRDIVGVVQDLYAGALDPRRAHPVAYRALAPGQLQAASLLVHVRAGKAESFIPKLQRIIASRNPDFRVGRIRNLAVTPNSRYLVAVITGLVLALGTVLLLSAVGVHALMSLTVTRRRKEIGIRIALGASRGRLVASIFSRAALQLGLGGFIGSLLGGVMLRLNGQSGAEATTFLAGVVGLMLLAGLAATALPARRGVRIQPMDALRADD